MIYRRDVNKHIVYGAMRANKLSTNSSPSNTPFLLLLLSSLRKALILRGRTYRSGVRVLDLIQAEIPLISRVETQRDAIGILRQKLLQFLEFPGAYGVCVKSCYSSLSFLELLTIQNVC